MYKFGEGFKKSWKVLQHIRKYLNSLNFKQIQPGPVGTDKLQIESINQF